MSKLTIGQQVMVSIAEIDSSKADIVLSGAYQGEKGLITRIDDDPVWPVTVRFKRGKPMTECRFSANELRLL